jgi:hypothetical protein
MTIWIFGDSLSLPYNLENPADGWPTVLSAQLKADCKNYAQLAVDNCCPVREVKKNHLSE